MHLVDADGTYHEDPDHPIDLSDEQLRTLYRHMVVTRRVDKEAINLQRQGQLGVYASCLGQEAAQVGGAYALGEKDWVFPSYREMGAAVARGVDTGKLLHLFRGTWLSDHDPYEQQYALLSASRSARRPCTPPGSRWAPSSTATRSWSWPTSVTGRPPRATRTRR